MAGMKGTDNIKPQKILIRLESRFRSLWSWCSSTVNDMSHSPTTRRALRMTFAVRFSPLLTVCWFQAHKNDVFFEPVSVQPRLSARRLHVKLIKYGQLALVSVLAMPNLGSFLLRVPLGMESYWKLVLQEHRSRHETTLLSILLKIMFTPEVCTIQEERKCPQ